MDFIVCLFMYILVAFVFFFLGVCFEITKKVILNVYLSRRYMIGLEHHILIVPSEWH